MDRPAFIIRLDALNQNVMTINLEVKKFLRPDRDINVKEEEVLRLINLLESNNNRFVAETHQYMEKHSEELCEKIEEYTKSQLEAEGWIAELKASKTQLQAMPVFSTKLPKMDLPKFNGDVSRFYEFWDRFEASVDKKNLNDADKLAYLFSCLEGAAEETVAGFNITSTNYVIVKETLIRRFGKKCEIIDAHYEALNNMKRASNIKECRRNLNEIERNLRILESLGEDINGNQFRATITNKFPEDITYELHVISQEKTMISIRKTLELIITAKESSKNDENIPNQTQLDGTTTALHTYNVTPKKINGSRQNKNRHGSLNTHHKKTRGASTSKDEKLKPLKRKFFTSNHVLIKKAKKECIFCKGDHFNADCTAVTGIKDRKLKLKDKCFRCFREGHRITSCSSRKRPCYYCKGDHNQALCPQQNSDRNGEGKPPSN